ncbi:MAG: hypothetical protein HY319_04180 [Armatimonadetes bacterium]|nr:hypothetical protein [Armatimonadota bacterium]
MPRFRFKVFDAEKARVRTGTLVAGDIEQARGRLEGKGLEIRSLEEVQDASTAAEYRQRKIESRLGVLEVQPGAQRVQRYAGVYRPSLWETVRDLRLPAPARDLLLGLIGLLGLILIVAGGVRQSWSPRIAQSQDYRQVHVTLRGQLALPEGGSPQHTRVAVSLPQIPLTVNRKGSEVVDRDGNLQIELSFSSRRVPGYCELTVERPGCRPVRLEHIPLAGGERLSATLPPIRLVPSGP